MVRKAAFFVLALALLGSAGCGIDICDPDSDGCGHHRCNDCDCDDCGCTVDVDLGCY